MSHPVAAAAVAAVGVIGGLRDGGLLDALEGMIEGLFHHLICRSTTC